MGRQGHKQKEEWTLEKGANPTAQLGLSWGNTQAAVSAGLQGPSVLPVTLGEGLVDQGLGKVSITPTSHVPTHPKTPSCGQDAHERGKRGGRTRI